MVPLYVVKAEKILVQIKKNPKSDWTIDDLKRLAHQYDIEYRQPKGSHLTFRSKDGAKLTVPIRRPIKEFYIKQFVIMIEHLGEKK